MQVLPMTTHDLPWEPTPLLSIIVMKPIEFIRHFYRAMAPRLPLLQRDYIIHP